MRKKGSWVLYTYRWKSEEKEMSLLDIKELSSASGTKYCIKMRNFLFLKENIWALWEPTAWGKVP